MFRDEWGLSLFDRIVAFVLAFFSYHGIVSDERANKLAHQYNERRQK